jgi:hypothetical protein
MKKLELAYNVIDVCVNECILFQGNYVNVDQCIKCGETSYQQVGNSIVVHKVLCHFPLIPRLQRMFNTPTQLKLMVWHWHNRNQDGLLVGSKKFKDF